MPRCAVLCFLKLYTNIHLYCFDIYEFRTPKVIQLSRVLENLFLWGTSFLPIFFVLGVILVVLYSILSTREADFPFFQKKNKTNWSLLNQYSPIFKSFQFQKNVFKSPIRFNENDRFPMWPDNQQNRISRRQVYKWI